MESLERKYIQQFVSSSVATEVKNRLTKCYDRLLRAGTELGAPQSGTFYEIRSRGEIQAFLTAICSPTEVDPLLDVNSSRVTEWRALALRKLSSSLVGTRMMLVPLVFVSLETHQKYRIYESLLVKSVTAGSDVTFYDMKGRRFWRFDQFLDGGGFPYGILCYSGSNGSLEYQIVGMKSVVTRTTDALFGTLSIIGSVGLIFASESLALPIGLGTTLSNIYLVARGIYNFLRVEHHSDLNPVRTTSINLLLAALNFICIGLVSMPCVVGPFQGLSASQITLLGGCAISSFFWMMQNQLNMSIGYW
ncbi:uncharacterized protein LOC6045235 [Culex quinquefasciatus]|uniref:uncharacterized protein LOC6045235 n=1 Tax=Culex quinquefasciatus TaxID=7176 RepID=UPI0018E36E39|nr:uncharacterized protein LOC6045235 [Culex quinquefasciatus]